MIDRDSILTTVNESPSGDGSIVITATVNVGSELRISELQADEMKNSSIEDLKNAAQAELWQHLYYKIRNRLILIDATMQEKEMRVAIDELINELTFEE